MAAATLMLQGAGFHSTQADDPGGTFAARFHPLVVNLESGLLAGEPFRAAQTFTATLSGPLDSVAVLLARNGPRPDLVGVALLATDPAGGPGEMLAQSSVSGAELPDRVNPGFLEAGFGGAGLTLQAGVSYAILVDVDFGGVGWHGTLTGPGITPPFDIVPESYGYAEGALWETFDAGAHWTPRERGDLGFEVRLIPEPEARALLLAGLTVLAGTGGMRREGCRPGMHEGARSPAQDLR